MTLDNPSNWSRVFEGTFYMAQLGSYRGRIEPIWSSPFTYHTIRVRTTSTEAKDTWKYAGKLVQVFGIEEMETVPANIPLNRYTLIVIPQPILDYRLRFQPAPWHKQIQIVVDAYNDL